MQEHLKRITVPLADGSRRELSLLTMEDLREPLERLAAIGEKVAAMAEFYDVLLSKGPKGLAEHIIRYAVSLPAGNYDSMLYAAEHLSPGILSEMILAYDGVSPQEVADHFPDVIAIVSPADACFVERAAAYVAGGVYFASNGLLLRSMMNYSQYAPRPYPRNVDSIRYWNFASCPYLVIEEAIHNSLDKDAIPYKPPQSISNLVNLSKCSEASFVDSTGRSRLRGVEGSYGIIGNTARTSAFGSAFRDWASAGYPDNEVTVAHFPTVFNTSGLNVDNLFAGQVSALWLPSVTLDACAGTNLFQRNPDRPPLANVVARHCLVLRIGSVCTGTDPQTDLSGLEKWFAEDMELSLQNTAPQAAVSGWRILLSKDCYTRLSSNIRASLAAKGFTVVNAG